VQTLEPIGEATHRADRSKTDGRIAARRIRREIV
jgi:hypothetical protein